MLSNIVPRGNHVEKQNQEICKILKRKEMPIRFDISSSGYMC